MRLLQPFLFLLVFSLAGFPAFAQNAAPPTLDEARAELIVENLKLQFSDLREMNPAVTALQPTDIPGLDRGLLTIQGQSQPFLVTSDNTQLYFLAADAVDVSRPLDEVREEMAALEQTAREEARARQQLLEEAVADQPARGGDDASVTIVAFSDFQCPYCARGTQTIDQVLARYPDSVRFVHMHYPLPNHQWAEPAAVAAVCAAEQDPEAFWRLHDGYFADQRAVTETNVLEKGRALLAGADIDLETWQQCAADEDSEAHLAASAAVSQAAALGQQLGVTGTPAYFVNGTLISGAQPVEAFVEAIEQAAQDAP